MKWNQVWIWCEGSAAYNRGIKGAVVMAISGKVAGCENMRIWHPWYGDMGKPATQAKLNSWAKTAKAQGCVALGIDAEGWLWKPTSIAMFAAAAKSVGLPLYAAPKASCDPGGKFLDGNFAKSVACLNKYTQGCLLWAYSANGAVYSALVKKWRAAGFKGVLGCFQDTWRNDPKKGYYGKLYWKSVVEACRYNRWPFCLFHGNHSTSGDIALLKKYYA